MENKAANALSRKATTCSVGEFTAVTELIPQRIQVLKTSYEGDKWANEVLKNHKKE